MHYNDLSEEEQVAYWQSQIGYAQDLMKPYFGACQVLLDQYESEAASAREADLMSDGSDDDDHTKRTKSSIVFGWIDQTIANMIDREPVFRAQPTNKIAIPYKKAVTAIQNHYYRITNQLRTDERCALDAFLMPYGVAKIGYHVDFEERVQEMLQPDAEFESENPEEENIFMEDGFVMRVSSDHDHELHKEIHTQYLQNPAISPETQALLTDHLEVHNDFQSRPAPDASSNVKRERPFGMRWRPDMFLMDWTAQEGLSDAQWIAFGWERRIDEVQADPNLGNTDDLEPGGDRPADAPERPTGLDHDGFDMIRGWEIWTREFAVDKGKFEKKLMVISENSDKFHRDEHEWPYAMDDFPAEVVSFQQGVRTWFNKPTLLMAGADSIQSLVNEILDSYLYVARKQKNIWLFDPAFIDQATLSNILEQPDGSMYPVKGLADREHTGRIVAPLEFLQSSNEKGELLNVSLAMFDRAAGTPQPQRQKGADSATEASIMDRKNTARENRRGAILSEFQMRKAQKFWQLLSQYRPNEIILVDDLAEEALDVSDEMAQGDFLFTLDISSQSSALAVERSQWLDLLNLFSGLTPLFIQAFKMPPNIPEIARRLLERGFNVKDAEEILPMVNAFKEQMGQAPPPPGGGPGEGEEEAIREGRNQAEGIGAFNPDNFNKDIPSEGQQTGEAQSAR